VENYLAGSGCGLIEISLYLIAVTENIYEKFLYGAPSPSPNGECNQAHLENKPVQLLLNQPI